MGQPCCCTSSDTQDGLADVKATQVGSDQKLRLPPPTPEEKAQFKKGRAGSKGSTGSSTGSPKRGGQQSKDDKRKREEEKALKLERLGPLGKPGAKIQVELETGWSDMSAADFRKVCDQVGSGATRFAIPLNGVPHFFDWANPQAPTQKNMSTGQNCKLRVVAK
jgi:hypothetical protein